MHFYSLIHTRARARVKTHEFYDSQNSWLVESRLQTLHLQDTEQMILLVPFFGYKHQNIERCSLIGSLHLCTSFQLKNHLNTVTQKRTM